MKKSTLILAVVFVVLVGVVLITRQGPKVERGTLASSLAKLDTLTVNQIQIKKPDEEIIFEKRNGQWMITAPIQYRANQGFVRQMLSTFIDLRVESAISENPDKHGKFQVDTTGTEVAFLAGDRRLVSIVVGKPSQDYSHTYVRQSDSPEVSLVKGVLSGQLNRNLDTWRDKTIFAAEKTDITQLALVYPEETITLYWSAGNWMMAAGGEESLAVDQPTVDRMLNTLSNFRASLFPKEEEYEGVRFDEPDFRVDVTTVDGTTLLRMVEEKEKNRYFVQKEGEETVFQVYRGTVSNLMKKVEDLKAKGEPPATEIPSP
ncbi:MAG: DUF4340 domain-containing protein [bacterium]